MADGSNGSNGVPGWVWWVGGISAYVGAVLVARHLENRHQDFLGAEKLSTHDYKLDHKLIKRVAQMQSYDVSLSDIRDELIKEGYTEDDVFNAYQAAKGYLKREGKELGSGKKPKKLAGREQYTKDSNGKYTHASDDEWSIVADAVYEAAAMEPGPEQDKRLKQAARLWANILETYGDNISPPGNVWDAERGIPGVVRLDYAFYIDDLRKGTKYSRLSQGDDLKPDVKRYGLGSTIDRRIRDVVVALQYDFGLSEEDAEEAVSKRKGLTKKLISEGLGVDLIAKQLFTATSDNGMSRVFKKGHVSDDEWSIVEDAVREAAAAEEGPQREKRLKQAAQTWADIRHRYGFVMGPQSLYDAFMDLPMEDRRRFGDLVGGYKGLIEDEKGDLEGTVKPIGQCFPWAQKQIAKGGVLKQGLVTHPWDKHQYAHAWIEKNGKVYDWQTAKLRKGKALSVDQFNKFYQPVETKTFDKDSVAQARLHETKLAKQLGSPESDAFYAQAKDAIYEADDAMEHGQDDEAKKRYREALAVVQEAKELYPAEPRPTWYEEWATLNHLPGGSRVWAAKKRTYTQAQQDLMNEMKAQGWTLSPSLKIPHATSPNGKVRLWLKPQAVWLTTLDSSASRHDYKDARTISYDLDLRKSSPKRFLKFMKRYGA